VDTVRRYVFPLLWILVLGVIAASLAKLAFFSDGPSAQAGDDAAPAADLVEESFVTVEKGDVASTLSLSGTVRPDAGRAVPARTTGEVVAVWVKNGEHVGRGSRILQVKVPREVEPPAPPTAAPGATAPPAAPVPQAPQFTYHNLSAPGSGTVRDLKAVVGQTLTAGDVVASLSPGTYSVVADLTPEQQLQLLDRRVEATATVPGRRAPLACASTRIDEDDPEPEQGTQPGPPQIDPNTGMPMESAQSQASLRCAVPEDAKVVPGLAVKVGVDLGKASKTLVVPTTAVEGSGDDGAVYLRGDGGQPERHPVKLGLRGENVVQVVSGLKEGQEILRFVPGVDNPDAGQGGQGGPVGPGW